MKTKTILRLLPLFIIIGAFIDTNLNIIEDLGLSEVGVKWIKLLGLIFTALLPPLIDKVKES